jgi:hypothetical protein
MMRETKICAIFLFAWLTFAGNVSAVALNGEHSITISITNNGSNSYTFDYSVTNINQSFASAIQP